LSRVKRDAFPLFLPSNKLDAYKIHHAYFETFDKTELQQSLKRIIITNDKATLWEKPMRRDAIMKFHKIIWSWARGAVWITHIVGW
jgi:hypothetical protein